MHLPPGQNAISAHIQLHRQHCNRFNFQHFSPSLLFLFACTLLLVTGNSPTSPTFRYQVLVVSTTFMSPCLVDAFCCCRRAGLAGPTICTLAYAGPKSAVRKQDAALTRTSTVLRGEVIYTVLRCFVHLSLLSLLDVIACFWR